MIGDFLNKLEKVQGKRGHWVACCPARQDKRPSLAITETDDGRNLCTSCLGCSFDKSFFLTMIVPEMLCFPNRMFL